MLNKLFALAPVVLLAACASLTQEQCETGDWSSIGYNDGVEGRSESYINQHRDACGEYGITPDVNAWLAGREQGLKQYCTRPNAYQLGRSGDELNPVCRTDVDALKLANFYGLRYYELDQMIVEARDEMNTYIEALASDDGSLSPEIRQFYLGRIRELQYNIALWEAEKVKYAVMPN